MYSGHSTLLDTRAGAKYVFVNMVYLCLNNSEVMYLYLVSVFGEFGKYTFKYSIFFPFKILDLLIEM